MEDTFLNDVDCEEDLKAKLEPVLEKDFYLHSEVWGVNGEYRKRIRIDYMCYPKKETINAGFPPWWFGIEVKYFLDTDEIEQKYDHLLQQAEFYCDSAFTRKPTLNCCRPTFVLVYDNLSLGHNYLARRDGRESKTDIFLCGMIYHARSKKVGSLKITHTSYGLKYAMYLYSEIFSVNRTEDGKVLFAPPRESIKNEVLHITLGSTNQQTDRNTFAKDIIPLPPEPEVILYYPD